jgi:uncharacterized membrane protein
VRIITVIIGVFVLVVTYLVSVNAPYHVLPILGYAFGAILVVGGLLTPSRREMWQRRKEQREAKDGSAADPEAILKMRYAKGEITKQQYDKMKKDIGSQ